MSEPVDTLRFADSVGTLPEQVEEARGVADGVDLGGLPDGSSIRHVVTLGMGGSGIAGDVLAAVTRPTLRVPITVLKQYRVPACVDANTLVFALSYSGTTEETVTMARAASERGASVVAVSAGGELADLVGEANGVHVSCPHGYMPRAALGALATPLFVVLARLGLLPDVKAWLDDAVEQIVRRRDRCRPSVTGSANPAREMARRIGRTIPVIYGGGALGQVAAMRWKADINENAKAPAFWNAYPELDHNEICGWGQHGDVTRQVFTMVELRHAFEHERLDARFTATREIVDETVAQVLEVRAEGEGRLAQVLDLMYVGDWTSLYLAYDAGVDPGPIDAISQLKEALGPAGNM